jgi:hypothetical protein
VGRGFIVLASNKECPMPISPEVASLVGDSVEKFNREDIDGLMSQFREDAVLSSPFAENHGTAWIQGREAISAHLKYVRELFPTLGLVDLATDAIIYVALFKAGDTYLTIVVEPELPSGHEIKRFVICKSIYNQIEGAVR